MSLEEFSECGEPDNLTTKKKNSLGLTLFRNIRHGNKNGKIIIYTNTVYVHGRMMAKR